MGTDDVVRDKEGNVVPGIVLRAVEGAVYEDVDIIVEEEVFRHEEHDGPDSEADRMVLALTNEQRVELVEDLNKDRRERLMKGLTEEERQELFRLLAGGAAEIPYERMRSMSPDKLNMLFTKSSPEAVAATLVSLSPEELAEVLARMDPRLLAKILVTLPPDVLSHVLDNLPDDDDHDKHDPLASTLDLLTPEETELILWRIPPADLPRILLRLQADELLAVLDDQLTPDKWKGLLLRMSPEGAGSILGRYPPLWAKLFKRMDPADVYELLMYADPKMLGGFLRGMPRDDLIDVLENCLDDKQRLQVLLRADGESLGLVLSKLPKEMVDAVVAGAIKEGRISELLRSLPPALVPGVLSRLDVDQVAQVLGLLDAATLEEFFSSLSDEELGAVMSRLSAEQRMAILAKLPPGGRAAEIAARAEKSVVARKGEDVLLAIQMYDSTFARWAALGTNVDVREAVLYQLPDTPQDALNRLQVENNRLDRAEKAATAARDALLARAKVLTGPEFLGNGPGGKLKPFLYPEFAAGHQGIARDHITLLKSRVDWLEKTWKPKELKAEAARKKAESAGAVKELNERAKKLTAEWKAAKDNKSLDKEQKAQVVASLKAEAAAVKAQSKADKKEAKDAVKALKAEAKSILGELRAAKTSPESMWYKAMGTEKKFVKWQKKQDAAAKAAGPRWNTQEYDAGKDITGLVAPLAKMLDVVRRWNTDPLADLATVSEKKQQEVERKQGKQSWEAIAFTLQPALLAQWRGSDPGSGPARLKASVDSRWEKRRDLAKASQLPLPYLWIVQGGDFIAKDPENPMHAILAAYERVKAMWALLGTAQGKRKAVYTDLGSDPATALAALKKEFSRLRNLEMAACAERANLIARGAAALGVVAKAGNDKETKDLIGKFEEDHKAVSGDAIRVLGGHVEVLELASQPKRIKGDLKAYSAAEKAKIAEAKVNLKGKKTEDDGRGVTYGAMYKAYTKSKFYNKFIKKGGARPPSAKEEPKPHASAYYSWALAMGAGKSLWK
mmetsp:Transcript_31224/g.99564  ORF Transcript_31224/g.99564 Transcript_31224/m.99564 type:complete len:1016 (-) Transcript_31224:156-3203(-)